jgi:hypothetical protein
MGFRECFDLRFGDRSGQVPFCATVTVTAPLVGRAASLTFGVAPKNFPDAVGAAEAHEPTARSNVIPFTARRTRTGDDDGL